jgi:hypothetical protein
MQQPPSTRLAATDAARPSGRGTQTAC